MVILLQLRLLIGSFSQSRALSDLASVYMGSKLASYLTRLQKENLPL
jgi:hypothetical protein